MLKQIFKLNRAYREAKEQAVHETVNVLETKTNPLLFIFFLALTIFEWLGVSLTPIGPMEIYEAYGFSPIVVVFVISYFSFFLGSKVIFRPTAEELADDTSSFALFSACRRRELRSLISIGLSFLHTLIFFLYLISKDPKLLDLL